MIPRRRRLTAPIPALAALVGLLCLVTPLGCGGGEVAPTREAPDASDRPTRPRPECAPEQCHAFCQRARCLFPLGDAAACERHCADRCGDAFFDASDSALMRCVAEAEGSAPTTCAAVRDCCDGDFTNQLCPIAAQ
ncbi:MAG: hypothetical protein CSA66_05625 [Proteobacteria bacterium]|nr:MAG: hypothetical protein CSA66_05625 [Pseudomonadota bacterium]